MQTGLHMVDLADETGQRHWWHSPAQVEGLYDKHCMDWQDSRLAHAANSAEMELQMQGHLCLLHWSEQSVRIVRRIPG